jgi:outer membrane protein assembly factor BamB
MKRRDRAMAQLAAPMMAAVMRRTKGLPRGRAHRHLVGMMLAMSVLLTACGGGGDESSTGPRSQSKPTVANASPQVVVPLEKRLIGKAHIPDGDTMVEVGGSVWVKTDDGQLVRVDPATTRVTGRLQLDQRGLGQRYCEGIGSDGTSVWTCATNADATPIVRVDPVTAKVVQRYEVDKNFDQLNIPFVNGMMWVLTDDGSTITGLRAGSGSPYKLELGVRCLQATGDGSDLVLTCPADDSVRRVDVETGKTLAKRHLERPYILSASKSSVWVGTTAGVERLDAKTLARLTLFPGIELETTGDIAASDDEVWVRTQGPFLYHIDPNSLRVTEQVSANPALSGGSLLVTDDALWTTAFNDSTVFHLRR